MELPTLLLRLLFVLRGIIWADAQLQSFVTTTGITTTASSSASSSSDGGALFSGSTTGGRCPLSTNTEECPELMKNFEGDEACDCYNFCGGEFLQCCSSDGTSTCSLACAQTTFVFGCTDAHRSGETPDPNSSSPFEEILSGGVFAVGTCPTPVQKDRCPEEMANLEAGISCECYNFCNGEFLKCCDKTGLGQDAECQLECLVSDVGGGGSVFGCTDADRLSIGGDGMTNGASEPPVDTIPSSIDIDAETTSAETGSIPASGAGPDDASTGGAILSETDNSATGDESGTSTTDIVTSTETTTAPTDGGAAGVNGSETSSTDGATLTEGESSATAERGVDVTAAQLESSTRDLGYRPLTLLVVSAILGWSMIG